MPFFAVPASFRMLYTSVMLFMVIERFKSTVGAVGDRFRRQGRMLPEGAVYHASWVDAEGGRCFQVMEAPHRECLTPWVQSWSDLIAFEIIPVLTSKDFWSPSTACNSAELF
jgi:hypothetical protein